MKDFKIIPIFDEQGNPAGWDMAVEKGDFVFVTGKAAVAQGLGIRLRTWLGENFAAPHAGIDLLKEVLEQGEDSEIARAAFTRCILGSPGVTELKKLTFTPGEKRQLLVTGKVGTVYGNLDLSESLTP